MTNQSVYAGVFFSRSLCKDMDFAKQALFEVDTFAKMEFSTLPRNVQENFKKKAKDLEREFRGVVECVVVYDSAKSYLDIKLAKRAKISNGNYLEIMENLVNEKVIGLCDVLKYIPLEYVGSWIASKLSKTPEKKNVIEKFKGLTYGIGQGVLLTGRKEVQNALQDGKKVVMLAGKLTQEDLEVFAKLSGLILTKSGATSHAAVIAKGLGIPCVLGFASEQLQDYIGKDVCLDGGGGILYKGRYETEVSLDSKFLQQLMKKAQEVSILSVASNSDTSKDALLSNRFFAKGIGLCRTEHMFLNKEGRKIIRKILFSQELKSSEKQKFLKKQRDDFLSLFKTQDKSYTVVRLLDAPLNEFATKSAKGRALVEENPMLGFRGARFLLKNQEIMNIQVKAVCEAVKLLHKEGMNMQVRFEIPMVLDPVEIDIFASAAREEVATHEFDKKFEYKIGTMIEIPRSAYLISKIASKVDFISFGTNDLTQMFCGLSRDDSESFLGLYQKKGIFAENPFVSLDQRGVGGFIVDTIKRAKRVNPSLLVSVCGEQAADPESIKFLTKTGVDTLSCSGARVPLALFAAAKYSL
jgi:pyruvate, orthophosphate dikinase